MNASKKDEVHYSTVDSGQRKRYIRSVNKKEIILPDVHKAKRRRWIKCKEYMSRFFDNLDYNPKNEINNHEEIVSTKASLKPSLMFYFLNEMYKIIPMKNVIKLE